MFRTEYDNEDIRVKAETEVVNDQPSLTQQHQKDEADINTILKRFAITGELPTGVRMPVYGDFTGITDYQSALNAVNEANEAFAQMPADIRKRFNNDAEQFVAFCSDDANREEAEKLGLVRPKETPPATTAQTPPATPSATAE